MATATEQLEAMRSLPDNWDAYGGAAPDPKAIDLARAFVELIEGFRRILDPNANPTHVSPTRAGGVLVEWEDRQRAHEIEISPDGSISFLHVNKPTGEIKSRTFSPDPTAVVQPELLHELRCSLAA
jgi:hypothetical protein